MPEIEEREAATFSGYNWRQWTELPRGERVDGVAYFRARRAITMHQHDAQERDAEKKQRQAAARGRKGHR